MNLKIYKTLNDIMKICSFILAIISVQIISNIHFQQSDLPIVNKLIIFTIYMVPTILFILSILEFKKSNCIIKHPNIYDFKNIRVEYILFLFIGSIAIYILVNKYYFLGIYILLLAIEIIYMGFLNSAYLYKILVNPWDIAHRVRIEELGKYKKWRGFLYESLFSSITSLFIIIPIISLLVNWDLFGFNIITIGVVVVSFILYALNDRSFKQILDVKFNSFVKYEAKCIKRECSGKGTGGYYIVKVKDAYNIELSISFKDINLKEGQTINIIIGEKSHKIIDYY